MNFYKIDMLVLHSFGATSWPNCTDRFLHICHACPAKENTPELEVGTCE